MNAVKLWSWCFSVHRSNNGLTAVSCPFQMISDKYQVLLGYFLTVYVGPLWVLAAKAKHQTGRGLPGQPHATRSLLNTTQTTQCSHHPPWHSQQWRLFRKSPAQEQPNWVWIFWSVKWQPQSQNPSLQTIGRKNGTALYKLWSVGTAPATPGSYSLTYTPSFRYNGNDRTGRWQLATLPSLLRSLCWSTIYHQKIVSLVLKRPF